MIVQQIGRTIAWLWAGFHDPAVEQNFALPRRWRTDTSVDHGRVVDMIPT